MQSNRSLYKDFPPELRNAYGDALRAQEWSSKHRGLLDFAESTLTYLASLSLSDYRTHHAELADGVESKIESLRKRPLTMGSKLTLFQASAKAMQDPLVPPAKLLDGAKFGDVERFVAAIAAIEAAIKGLSPGVSASAIDVPHHVAQAEPDAANVRDWWEAWWRLIEYRNRVNHAVGKDPWPIAGDGYSDAMVPLLHDALVEVIAHEAIVDSVLRHPVGTITLLAQKHTGDYVHRVCGEERGVLFDEEVVAKTPVTERWAERWAATTATSYVLHHPEDEWAIRNPFWDLRNGLPPALDLGIQPSVTTGAAVARKRRKPPPVKEGRGRAPGTCGEFIQGVLPDKTRFHVTCPINMSSTVVVKLGQAEQPSVTGLRDYQHKLALAIEYTAEKLDIGPQEVTVWPWSDIDVGKGMGSSTADVLAGIRAVTDAAGERLDGSEEGEIAARVESSDGSMYPGIAAVNHRTCEMVKAWDWYPEFAIVMLVPQASVDTHSIPFTRQEELASEYEILLANMDRAIVERSLSRFAEQSTRSAELNQRFLVNPYSNALSGQLDELGAVGLNVGHTGTVCGLLFPNTVEGQKLASEACFKVKEKFHDLKDVKVVTTPYRDQAS